MVEQIIKINIISIHAPLRERRNTTSRCLRINFISIHAPSRERLDVEMVLYLDFDFNPRSLTGATQGSSRHVVDEWISIHAPSRERRWL